MSLNNLNQRQTRQKSLILETIRKESSALTADQILSRVRSILPSLALTTVYRNLELLTQQQVISRLIYPDGITRYQLAAALHHHQLVCLKCARTVEISQCPLDCLSRQIEKESGFTIISHQLALYGYCSECRRQKKEAAD
jgi:Fur family transcriptional regulator, ferric uptake regulator